MAPYILFTMAFGWVVWTVASHIGVITESLPALGILLSAVPFFFGDGNGNRRGLGLSWAQGPVVHYLRDGCEVLPVGWVLWILGDPEGTLMIRMVETNLGDGKVCRQTITTRWWPWLDLSREWIGFRTIHEGTLRTDG